ncbi:MULTISPECIES: LysR family transcriptional regulator [unclassified Caballeronia]|uniref:LysR family transcriptional regulator n=1 Tax=unclassified Caballeronia TaxID=2646786 RepID=UPI001F3A0407|nr:MULTISPECIES: LysR family transcriptional regulator [unclassified Caballeronia]MCE4546019.1 LysR family transcriptional regulator [Caballeronia sp. PC1]MCE4573508.1 LysR family transcriptional regulator [Caballeronia sp. CLC5]
MHLSLEHVTIFVAAARGKSFSETGRRLGKTQSAISTAIAELEIDLGVTLFSRDGRYPVLTPAGEALLDEADAILSRCVSLRERAGALTGEAETALAIAIEDAFPYAELAPVFDRLNDRYPGLRLDLLQPSTSQLLELVLSGSAVLGLGCARPNYPPGIGFCRLGHITLVDVAHHEHPLAKTPGVRFAQLADHLQLMLPAQTSHLLTTEYLKSPRRWHIQSEVALIELLKSGIGWAVVPRRLIEAELENGELRELQLQSYPFTEWTIGLDLIWRSDVKPGVIATWLKSEIARTPIFA